jgi:hypothetical protein
MTQQTIEDIFMGFPTGILPVPQRATCTAFSPQPPPIGRKGRGHSCFDESTLKACEQTLYSKNEIAAALILHNFTTLMKTNPYDREDGLNAFIDAFIKQEPTPGTPICYSASREVYYLLLTLLATEVDISAAATIFAVGAAHQIFQQHSNDFRPLFKPEALTSLRSAFTFFKTHNMFSNFPYSIMCLNNTENGDTYMEDLRQKIRLVN